MPVYSIGHSNHNIEKFLSLLATHNVEVLADVRMFPRSRFNPQFNAAALEKTLAGQGILYIHMQALGGMRKPKAGSVNQALSSEGFRGYADHMPSVEFQKSLQDIIEISANKSIVTMCAEAKPSECHRSLLADALLARGLEVLHILPSGDIQPHKYTEFAVASGHEVTYPLPLFA